MLSLFSAAERADERARARTPRFLSAATWSSISESSGLITRTTPQPSSAGSW